MNMSATQSQSHTAPRSESRDSSSRVSSKESGHNHPARDDFERALQARQQSQEEQPGDGNEEPAGGDGGAAAWMSALSAPLPLRAAAAPASLCAAGMTTEQTGTRAVIEASLTACPGQAVTPLTGTNPAALWEVSVAAPNAVPIQLRAERTGGPEANRAWGLTIASPAANTEMLVRHAPRLNERLRKHAVGLSHVRIEEADEDQQ
jgi:hypothetical protein